MPPLRELTAQFWAAAIYSRRAPDRDQRHAQRILRAVARTATGPLQQRAKELIREDQTDEPTRYDH